MRPAKALSEQICDWRAERPDEWKMDEFIRLARDLEERVADMQSELGGALADIIVKGQAIRSLEGSLTGCEAAYAELENSICESIDDAMHDDY